MCVRFLSPRFFHYLLIRQIRVRVDDHGLSLIRYYSLLHGWPDEYGPELPYIYGDHHIVQHFDE